MIDIFFQLFSFSGVGWGWERGEGRKGGRGEGLEVDNLSRLLPTTR